MYAATIIITMRTITIDGIAYEVADNVADCLSRLKYERDENYRWAQQLHDRLQEAHKAIRIVKGVTTFKKVPKSQRSLFK